MTSLLNHNALSDAAVKTIAGQDNKVGESSTYEQTVELPAKINPVTEKQRNSSHYAVCPRSGLSYTVQDDFKAKGIATSIYTVGIDADKLHKLVSRNGSKCPASYVAAAILVTLDDNGLLAQVEQEDKYLRGKVVELLINHYDHHQLLALFWLVTNSKAYLKRTPIKLNLTTAMEYPASLFYQITSIAKQELETGDLPRSLSATIAYDKAKKASSKLKLKGVANSKQDPMSALKRIRDNTTKIAKAIIKSHEAVVIENPELTSEALPNPLISYKKAGGYLVDSSGPSDVCIYSGLRTEIKDRLAVLYKELHKEALGHMVIPRDGAVDKSFEIVIKLLEAKIDPVELEEVDF